VPRPIGREVLARPTLEAARALLGAHLVRDGVPHPEPRELRIGRIVEVEAYIGEDDRASHARFGRTARNAVMYGPPGTAYVYLVYGMYDCLNVVTEPEGHPAAVLVRAVEPVAGVEAMRAARLDHARRVRQTWSAERFAAEETRLERIPPTRLASGPGAVAAAFSIDRTLTGVDLCAEESPLRLELDPTDEPGPEMVATPRIGVDYAGEPWTSKPWRFVVAGSRSVSGPPPGR
jgi:DNA-3-methyladenine glycosylase